MYQKFHFDRDCKMTFRLNKESRVECSARLHNNLDKSIFSL